LLNKHPDKAAVLTVAKDLAQGYKTLPEAHMVVAQSAFAAEQYDLAMDEMRAAMKLRPDWELGALQYSQFIQQRESAQKAADYLATFLKDHPGARDARAHYARMLISAKQLPQARAQYQMMQEAQPANPDILVTIGLLSLQLDEFELADKSLKRALELNYRDPDTLRFYIGQAYEERKRPEDAMSWYAQVKGGDQYVPAQARYAFLLGRQNKLAEARTYLQNVEVANEEQRTVLIQAEAQLLRESKAYEESYDLLAEALKRQPENADLLYDAALAAEKLSKIDVLEANLRKLIKLKPDHAQAYNALGYTLADRTDRYAEAKEYVERALTLSPDDAFILDSMGWVHYRLGNHQEALDFLQRAYARRPDPEIAAHLGEVMWAKGKKAEAEQLWRSALLEHGDNELLQETVKRFLR
jgi:tetratricopeptide (TPR) repeat protein